MGKPTEKTDPHEMIGMSFRATLRHRDAIAAEAERAGLHVSAYMRRVVFAAAGLQPLEAIAYEADAEAQIAPSQHVSPTQKRMAALQRMVGRQRTLALEIPVLPPEVAAPPRAKARRKPRG